MHQRTSQVLYAYWNDVRGERIAPRRFDIEPSQIGAVLAETFILECTTPADAVFRLAGTKICDAFGAEFRSTKFAALFSEAVHAQLLQEFEDVQKQGAVVVLEARTILDDQREAHFEILILPLIHSGSTISRMLGAITAINPPAWLGSQRLPPLEITKVERIWPDGRPHAIADKFRHVPALTPEMSGARIVRAKRRSFRVLDGGLTK